MQKKKLKKKCKKWENMQKIEKQMQKCKYEKYYKTKM